MKNLEVANIFREIAKMLEIRNDNRFRIRAYERAAQNLESLNEDISHLVKSERLREIPGIGHDLAERIKEIVRTGTCRIYRDLKKTFPKGLLELLNIPSLGPKTIGLLYTKLRIKSVAGLEMAIKKNRLKGIFGIKEKTIENLLRGIEIYKRGRERMSLATADLVAAGFLSALKKIKSIKEICVAGSLRRQRESVRDIDILMISREPRKVMEVFAHLPQVKEILAQGETKSAVLTKEGIQVDGRVVAPQAFGAALLYFTGSKNFNIHLRQLAMRRGLKINEYGLFRNGRYIAGKSEEDILRILGLTFIVPELREDTGEIELAAESALPQLIELKDLKGDLHVHSLWSDGENKIEEIAQAAILRGYSYIAITDHSLSLKVAHGLGRNELKKKKNEIVRLNNRFKKFRILYATEVEIDSDGRLDYKEEILREFDLVVAAVHSGFKQSKEQLTKRITRACQNKYVNIIAHPFGRLMGVRDAYELDFDTVLKVCRQTNTYLEINAFPERLDLNDNNCRYAKEKGAKMAISTDAHSVSQLGMIKYGLAQARRGWLTKADVLNTLALEDFLKAIQK